jgi:NAD(P)-dependent dehydrogenase (short-subunit alcohol dehydrogenase family)
MPDISGQVAFITGAGSGIGQAMAISFAAAGAKVALIELNAEGAQDTLEKINAQGGTAQIFQCNIAEEDQVKGAISDINSTWGNIDILVNNAGIAHVGNVLNTNPDDLDRIYNVNVKGSYLCMHHILPQMVEKKNGVILNLASIASKVGIPDRFAYSMSKGAMLTMTLSVARDFVNEGIRCNCICPARVHTPFVDGFIKKNYPGKEEEMFQNLSKTQPIGRMGKPEEMAALALFLCSPEASFITGAAYDIDGGFCNLIQ